MSRQANKCFNEPCSVQCLLSILALNGSEAGNDFIFIETPLLFRMLKQSIQTKHNNYYCLTPSLRLGCSEYTLENWLAINN